MKVSAFFIIGYPDETLEDIALTEKFILDTDFDFVGISIFQPLPGSKIYQSLVDQGTIPAGFIPGHYQEVTFPRKNIDNETLRDAYNQLWNRYREHKGMPIQNRAGCHHTGAPSRQPIQLKPEIAMRRHAPIGTKPGHGPYSPGNSV
ncbi:MAG: hypothetical protein IPN59_08525 [Holophaga sp.]|nr:hypothetical protein [Holophaga sp.]